MAKPDRDGKGFGVSPVTVADFAVQVLVLGSLAKAFPNDRFIAEETSRELMAAGQDTQSALASALQEHGYVCDSASITASLDLGGTGVQNGWSAKQRTWVLDPIECAQCGTNST